MKINKLCHWIMFFLKSDYKFAIAVTIGLMMLCGCTTSTDKRASLAYPKNSESVAWPDKQLEKRFQEYWFGRFAGLVEDGYNIEAPYIRQVVSLGKYNNYVKHSQMRKLMNLEIQKITGETDFLISVSCVIRTQSVGGKPIDTPIIDRWVFVAEKWYHVIKDPIFLSF